MASLAPTPQTIASYVIERELARGSMGHVYVAHHSLTHSRVALKVLRGDIAGDEQAEERFLREVRAAAHIGHDGIVQVHDAGRTSDGQLYLAMELLEGETLEARLRRLPGERLGAMAWLLAVLDPLCAAHAQGIVHRDLKPANVFIAIGQDGKERIKLLDFGLARDMREKSVTATGIALGTPYYMSPEQATAPRNVGTQSDVWSMGVMMYEVLCGTMPFDGETLHAVVIQSSVAQHVPVLDRRAEVDPRLAAIVERCLCKERDARPRDARALRDLLAPLLETPEVQRMLDVPVELVPRTHRSASAADDESENARMPFAETAISLMPGDELLEAASRKRDYARVNGGGWGLWVIVLALFVMSLGGFFWLIDRDGTLAAEAPYMLPFGSADAGTQSDGTTEKKSRRKKRAARGDTASKSLDSGQLLPVAVDTLDALDALDASAAMPTTEDAALNAKAFPDAGAQPAPVAVPGAQ